VWPHRPQIRLLSIHFGLLIGAKSTLGALLIPLFGQFHGEVRRMHLLKLSEKSRRCPKRALTGHQRGIFRLVLSLCYPPNMRSEPYSDPFRTVSKGVFSEVLSPLDFVTLRRQQCCRVRL
jgi:hypothetical protein